MVTLMPQSDDILGPNLQDPRGLLTISVTTNPTHPPRHRTSPLPYVISQNQTIISNPDYTPHSPVPTDSISHRDACGVMAMALRRLSSSINRPLLTPFVTGNGGSVYHMVIFFKSQTYISILLLLYVMVLKFVFFNFDLIWIAVRSVQPSSSA